MATPAEIVTAIDTAVAAMISGGGAQTLEIAGRKVVYYNVTDLLKLREYYSGLDNASTDKMPFGMYRTKPKGVNS